MPIMNKEKSIWDQIGGRRAISLKGSLVNLPIIIFSVPLQDSEAFSIKRFTLWTLASAIGVIPAALLVFVAHKTHFKNRAIKALPARDVVLLGAIVGAVKGFTTGYAAAIFSLSSSPHQNEILFRTLNSALIGTIFLPLGSLIYTSIDQYISLRNNLVVEQVAIERNSSEINSITSNLRENMNNKVSDNLNKILDSTRKELSNAATSGTIETEWVKLATLLRKTASDSIRPLSHSLWAANSEIYTRPSLKEILLYGIKKLDFSPTLASSLFAITSFKVNVNNYGLFKGSLFLAFQTLGIFIILKISKKIYKSATKTAIRFIILYLSIGILQLFFTIFLIRIFDQIVHLTAVVFSTGWLLILIFVIGYIRAILERQNHDLVRITNLIDQTKLKNLAAAQENLRISREIAKYLHANIQSRIMASALAIEQAGKSGDNERLIREIKSAEKLLVIPSADYFRIFDGPPSTEIKNSLDKWDSLLQLEVENYLSDSDVSPQGLQDLLDSLDEAITNAYRHGRATKVKIEICMNQERKILLKVEDNGVGNLSGKPGLGFETYKRISGNNWTLRNIQEAEGILLQITIPNVFHV